MFQVFLPKKSKKNCRHLLTCSCSCWPWAGSPTCVSMQMKTDRNVIPTFFLRVFRQVDFFNCYSHGVRKMASSSFAKRPIKTGQRSFAFRGGTCWNKLPKDMKEVADCRIFKKRSINMFLK